VRIISPETLIKAGPLQIYSDIFQNSTLIAAAFFLFGLVLGSFLNVCIYRMPRELSVVSPRSACPACGTPISAYDNIPVLSWIILGGKCRNCNAPISPRYAIVELITGVFFVLSLLIGGSGPNAFKLSAFSFLMIGLVFTDAETKLLPDLLTKPGIGLGLFFSLLVPLEGPAAHFFPGIENWRVLSFINSLAGAALGSAFILGIAVAYEALRGVEGMGRGDVKLMGLIGAFVGVKLTLMVLLLGSLVGSCFGILLMLMVWRKRMARRRDRHRTEGVAARRSRAWQSAILIYRNFEIPFGVFLGMGAMIAAFWGDGILRWYMHFFPAR
jgi:leader peptidase (prepilin peptidase) / N-methyltransferase